VGGDSDLGWKRTCILGYFQNYKFIFAKILLQENIKKSKIVSKSEIARFPQQFWPKCWTVLPSMLEFKFYSYFAGNFFLGGRVLHIFLM
jgi:hypothetical protein